MDTYMLVNAGTARKLIKVLNAYIPQTVEASQAKVEVVAELLGFLLDSPANDITEGPNSENAYETQGDDEGPTTRSIRQPEWRGTSDNIAAGV